MLRFSGLQKIAIFIYYVYKWIKQFKFSSIQTLKPCGHQQCMRCRVRIVITDMFTFQCKLCSGIGVGGSKIAGLWARQWGICGSFSRCKFSILHSALHNTVGHPMNTRGSYPRAKRPEHDAEESPLSAAETCSNTPPSTLHMTSLPGA